MQVPEFWGGIEPPVPRCRNCNALAKKTYGPIVPMDKPNPHDQTYLDAFGQANVLHNWRGAVSASTLMRLLYRTFKEVRA